MVTLTATAATSAVPLKMLENGTWMINARWQNPGAVQISASATTVFMARIPHGVTVCDNHTYVSSGADTCPFVTGMETTLSDFATGGTKGVILRPSKGLPYDVSVSDDAVIRYKYFGVTVTPGTTTAAVDIKTSILCQKTDS